MEIVLKKVVCGVMEGKDFRFFMNVLMESDIMVDNPRQTYVHMSEIKRNFQAGQYFQATMHIACLMQSILNKLLLLKLPKLPEKYKAFEIKKMQELPFKSLIDWAAGNSIPRKNKLADYPVDWNPSLINENEKLILYGLREIRNDMAHIPYITYDANIKKDVVEKLIADVEPIQNKILDEVIENEKRAMEKRKNG